MLKIQIKQMTRRCRCHTPGCRSRNALKISRRDDVNGNPLFLCPACIEEIYDAYKSQTVQVSEEAKAESVRGNRRQINAGASEVG